MAIVNMSTHAYCELPNSTGGENNIQFTSLVKLSLKYLILYTRICLNKF